MNTHNQVKQSGGQRRGFFRRAGLLAAVAAIAGAMGGMGWHAHAHGGHGFRDGMSGGPQSAAQMDERIERMLKRVFTRINATPEQQQKLEPIAKQAARDLQPLRAQMQTARKQALEVMSAETVDRAAIERLRTQQLQAADALSRRVTQALADAAEILTPAQRKELAEHMQRRHGMGHRGMGHHG
jgi:Spy/CpxP family protein refolding chaperone